MSGIEILGTGSYVPEFVADNNKFAEFLDTSDEWITPRTGIKQRHILTDKPGYYMGIEAAKKALDDAGVKPEEVDLVLVSTCAGFLLPLHRVPYPEEDRRGERCRIRR